MSILTLSSYGDLGLSSFSPRSFVLLLFILISINTFKSKEFNYKNLFILGLFSAASLILINSVYILIF